MIKAHLDEYQGLLLMVFVRFVTEATVTEDVEDCVYLERCFSGFCVRWRKCSSALLLSALSRLVSSDTTARIFSSDLVAVRADTTNTLLVVI